MDRRRHCSLGGMEGVAAGVERRSHFSREGKRVQRMETGGGRRGGPESSAPPRGLLAVERG